jgi:hypothetical protein
MVEHVGSEESVSVVLVLTCGCTVTTDCVHLSMQPMFQSMIPKIMTVINALIEQDEVRMM